MEMQKEEQKKAKGGGEEHKRNTHTHTHTHRESRRAALSLSLSLSRPFSPSVAIPRLRDKIAPFLHMCNEITPLHEFGVLSKRRSEEEGERE